MTNENSFIHLPAYEPAGRDVRLDEGDLLQHLLIIGATGCGKTTLLRRILSQLIARPDTGLLIFDAKQDDTVPHVTQLAAQHHRELTVLGTQGTHYLDLFQPLRGLTDVAAMLKRLMMGTQNMGPENEFWNEIRRRCWTRR
jgi:ABC-type transporter Mla maintaining outer membrane lipid asymmetry ATPase subunit MlaF